MQLHFGGVIAFELVVIAVVVGSLHTLGEVCGFMDDRHHDAPHRQRDEECQSKEGSEGVHGGRNTRQNVSGSQSGMCAAKRYV